MRTNQSLRIARLILALTLCFLGFGQNAQAQTGTVTGYTETRYPIVLVHGLMGFRSQFFGLVDYWPGIAQSLSADGADVYIAQTSALNSSEARGEMLITQIEAFLATTGQNKVNLIGHSQGTLDIRYVTTVRPDLVASISSIAGPHGTELGNTFQGTNSTFAPLITLAAYIVHLFSFNSNPIDTSAGLNLFTANGMNAFRANYPIGLPTEHCGEGTPIVNLDGHTIYIYSWGGIGGWTTLIDPTDWLLAFTGSRYPKGTIQDGLVTRCDSHLGDVIRDDYRHNHIDLANLMFGLVAIFEENPISIIRTHVNRLKNAGL